MTAARGAVGTTARNEQNVRTLITVLIALVVVGLAIYLLYTRNGGGREVTMASGLKYVDLVEGTGGTPQLGHKISVNYRGTLENGNEFDNSHGQPREFDYNNGALIPGWIEGLKTMKVGGKRKLTVPAKLAYGAQGKPGIPPNSTLIFEVDLVDAK